MRGSEHRSNDPRKEAAMFWWLDFNPQINGWTVHWPWSGSVTQDILSGLLSQARSSRVERRVLDEVASYGRQLGTLTDLVDEVADKLGDAQLTERGRHARAQLKSYKARIDRIKDEELRRLIPEDPEAAGRLLEALLVRHPQLTERGTQRTP
jgi:hypothetical protein